MSCCLGSRDSNTSDLSRRSLLRGPPKFSVWAQQNFFENELFFYQEVQRFQRETFPNNKAMANEARRIFATFLASSAPKEIALSASTMRALNASISKPHASLYQVAMLEVGGVLHSRLVEYCATYKLDIDQLSTAAANAERSTNSIPLRTMAIQTTPAARRRPKTSAT